MGKYSMAVSGIDLTGKEVTGPNGGRGVVVDGVPKKSGTNKGRVEVMWIGARYTMSAWPTDLTSINNTKES